VSRRFVVFVAATAGLLVFAGPGLSRPDTTNPAATVPIRVTVTDRAIRMSPSSAPRGVEGEFIVTNRGTKVHTIVVKDVGVGKRPGFTARLRPDQQKIFVMFLDYRGMLQCYSTDGSALKGTFRVT